MFAMSCAKNNEYCELCFNLRNVVSQVMNVIERKDENDHVSNNLNKI